MPSLSSLPQSNPDGVKATQGVGVLSTSAKGSMYSVRSPNPNPNPKTNPNPNPNPNPDPNPNPKPPNPQP